MAAQDFKRAGDGDTGPNTGGMGAYSPVPGAGAGRPDEMLDVAVVPTLAALRARGIDYRGVLYAGLMLTPDGPQVLEFNVRFGDPESQVVLLPLAGRRHRGPGCGRGRPARYGSAPGVQCRKRRCAWCWLRRAIPRPPFWTRIEGLEGAAQLPGVQLYSAGIGPAPDGDGLVTAGGRVLGVGGRGPLTCGRSQSRLRRRGPRFVARHDLPARHRRERIGGPGMTVATGGAATADTTVRPEPEPGPGPAPAERVPWLSRAPALIRTRVKTLSRRWQT